MRPASLIVPASPRAAAALATLVACVSLAAALPACGGGGDGFPCDSNPNCGAGSPNVFSDEASTVEVTIEDVIAKGCSRFYADCAYLCDNIWYSCAPSQGQCVTEEYASRVDEFDHPVVNAALAATCGDQILDAACTDIPPDTLECDYAVVEGCAVDADPYGNNYSFLGAWEVTTRTTSIPIDLCDDVEEWFAFDLAVGEVLRVTTHDPEPSAGNLRFRLYQDLSILGAEPDKLGSETSSWDGSVEELGPVDTAGRYYLSVEISGRALMSATLTVEVVTGP